MKHLLKGWLEAAGLSKSDLSAMGIDAKACARALKDMHAACRDAWQCGFMRGFNGNMSVRLDREDGYALLVTGTCVAKGHLKPCDVALADEEGRGLHGPAISSETAMHVAIYKKRPDVRYVLHVHPAAMLAHIVRLVSHNDEITLKEAVLDSKIAMKRIFAHAVELPDFLKLIGRAVELSESNIADLDAIRKLGQGWVGDEALAIAIYCAMKYDLDFDKAIIAAVNHGGDSDSTGAIAGNILGAYLGLSAIPEKYTKNLELLDVITEIAEDLYYDCQINEYTYSEDPRDMAWEKKYVDITYGGKDPDEDAGSSV